MNLLGASGKPITEEYIEQFGEEAYAEFDKFTYIKVHGHEAYDKKFGDLEAILLLPDPLVHGRWLHGSLRCRNRRRRSE